MPGFRNIKLKIHLHDAGHMTKMATMPIYGENTLKNLRPSKPNSTTLSMKHGRLAQARDIYFSNQNPG